MATATYELEDPNKLPDDWYVTSQAKDALRHAEIAADAEKREREEMAARDIETV